MKNYIKIKFKNISQKNKALLYIGTISIILLILMILLKYDMAYILLSLMFSIASIIIFIDNNLQNKKIINYINNCLTYAVLPIIILSIIRFTNSTYQHSDKFFDIIIEFSHRIDIKTSIKAFLLFLMGLIVAYMLIIFISYKPKNNILYFIFYNFTYISIIIFIITIYLFLVIIIIFNLNSTINNSNIAIITFFYSFIVLLGKIFIISKNLIYDIAKKYNYYKKMNNVTRNILTPETNKRKNTRIKNKRKI